MKNKFASVSFAGCFLALFSMLTYSCKKDPITVPNQQVAGFAGPSGSYFIKNESSSVFKIPVGVTTVSNVNRILEFTVSSPSGAEEGQQYTLGTTSVTIPAGSTVDSIELKGLFSGYATGRKDTLVFTMTGGDIPVMESSNEFTVYMQKYCDVDLNSFLGDYVNSSNSATGAKYKITVQSVESTGPTSGYLMVKGLYRETSEPVRVNLDWANPANFTTTVAGTSNIYTDATYGPVSVRPIGTGTFSSCDNTFTLSYQRYVAAGNFAANVTTMVR